MEIISGRQAQEYAARLIEALYTSPESNALSRLECALRLWSECRLHPDRRLLLISESDFKSDFKSNSVSDALTEGCDGVILTAPQTALPAGVRVYPLYAVEKDAPAAHDHLPPRESQSMLFGEDGLIRPEIAAHGLNALKAHRTAFVLLSGGAGTRYSDSAAALAQALHSHTADAQQKATLDIFEQLHLDIDKCLKQSKLFAPMGCLSGCGSLEVNLNSIAELLQKTHADVPVIIFCGDSTRADVELLLKKRSSFGLKNLAVIDQDMVPFVDEESGTLLKSVQDTACGANGGGGIVYSLGHAMPLDVQGQPLFNGSVLNWLKSLSIERIIFSQTDDAKRPEVYLGLCAAAAEDVTLVAAGSRYPTVLSDGKPAFKLGSLWSDGADALCCTEFTELQTAQIDLLTQENHPDGYAVANTGLYLADIMLTERIIDGGLLGIHFQHHKKETGADGKLHAVTKFEYFLPDLLGVASQLGAHCRIALLRDTSRLKAPLRNLTVDALPAKDIHKLALAQLAKLHTDKTLGRAAGLTIDEDALFELGSFVTLRAEAGARLKRGARVYISGAFDRPIEVIFKKTALIDSDLTITQSQIIE